MDLMKRFDNIELRKKCRPKTSRQFIHRTLRFGDERVCRHLLVKSNSDASCEIKDFSRLVSHCLRSQRRESLPTIMERTSIS